MRLRIAALALTLTLAGQTAFASQDCVTGCGTSEPCYDGYCVDAGWWEPCGDLWVIVQQCQPNTPAAQQTPFNSSASLFAKAPTCQPEGQGEATVLAH